MLGSMFCITLSPSSFPRAWAVPSRRFNSPGGPGRKGGWWADQVFLHGMTVGIMVLSVMIGGIIKGRVLIGFIIRGVTVRAWRENKRWSFNVLKVATGFIIMSNVKLSHIGTVKTEGSIGMCCVFSGIVTLARRDMGIRLVLDIR